MFLFMGSGLGWLLPLASCQTGWHVGCHPTLPPICVRLWCEGLGGLSGKAGISS